MSKARRDARVARQATALARADEQRAAADRAAAQRARRDRRRRVWAQLRLWQHGPGFRRRGTRERLGALASVVLILLVLVFAFTRSWSDVIGTALICVIAAPVLALLFLDRSRS